MKQSNNHQTIKKMEEKSKVETTKVKVLVPFRDKTARACYDRHAKAAGL